MKILIVDDQRSGRRVLKQMLGAIPDAELLEAQSLDEAIAVVEKSSPDLLLLDVRLSDDPRDRGGETSWENIVCSCVPCNSRKGNRTPQESGMRLLHRPRRLSGSTAP